MVSSEIILSNLTTSFNINKALLLYGFRTPETVKLVIFVVQRDLTERRKYYFHIKITLVKPSLFYAKPQYQI